MTTTGLVYKILQKQIENGTLWHVLNILCLCTKFFEICSCQNWYLKIKGHTPKSLP